MPPPLAGGEPPEPLEEAPEPPEAPDEPVDPEALEPPEEPVEDAAEPDELEGLLEAAVEVVEVLVVPEPEEGAPEDPAVVVEVGTVNGGAPEVSVALEPPPHPDTATARPALAASATTPARRRTRPGTDTGGTVTAAGGKSGRQGIHTAAAVRAVVQILLCELVAPVAEAKVLDRPGQL